jgi:hypothetical protein
MGLRAGVAVLVGLAVPGLFAGSVVCRYSVALVVVGVRLLKGLRLILLLGWRLLVRLGLLVVLALLWLLGSIVVLVLLLVRLLCVLAHRLLLLSVIRIVVLTISHGRQRKERSRFNHAAKDQE